MVFVAHIALIFVSLSFCSSCANAQEPPAQEIEYFEKHVRPLLVTHCYECHGPDDKPQGNLRLDAPEYWLQGGDTGPALVPSKPEASLVLKAIRYESSEMEMPPDGKLPEDAIRVFETWIRRGAHAPSGDSPMQQKRVIDVEAGKSFWAYRPLPNSAAPFNNSSQATHPIDRFVEARLNAAGISPNPVASPATLVRRLYFDLWGLPPTPEQILAFESSDDPQAYAKLVNELLASHHFGERWGRHWLDVVRYGESLTLRGFIMPEAWRYRDYVIDSFNEDRPFDEFVREQIAGDLLATDDLHERQRRLIATTFLTLGNTNLEEQDKKQLDMDVVDEQLDTLGKAFLAQTIGCARCHDHKFDPIPTRDYYALAGILRNAKLLDHANISKWTEVPLPLPTEQESIFAANETEIEQLETKIKQFKSKLNKLGSGDPEKDPDGRAAVQPASAFPGIVVDSADAEQVGSWTESQFSGRYIGTGFLHDENNDKGEKTLTFAPELPADGRYEVRLAYVPGNNRCESSPFTIFSADGEITVTVDQTRIPPIDRRFISLGTYRFEKAGQSYLMVTTDNTQGIVNADAVQFLPADSESTNKSEPSPEPVDEAQAAEIKRLKNQMKEAEKDLKRLQASMGKRPKAMTVAERSECADCPIHIRGSVHSLGDTVPRGFIQVATWGPTPAMSTASSGRRELAEWLSAPENPLTARVFVNRVWQALFGQGIVRTADNFGATGSLPTHPELLDHLAIEFIKQRWSLKQLVRSIVMSEAYQRSSAEQATGLANDPENQWLWRMPRKRLEAECLRDAMLAVSGQLDTTPTGSLIPPNLNSDFGYVEKSLRRSVYLPVLRNAIPDLFEVFDVADPSMVVGTRNVSTVAPQALFLMNHSFVREQAAEAAQRLLASHSDVDSETTLRWTFEQCYGRGPSESELKLAKQYLSRCESKSMTPLSIWTSWYHSLFSSLDFRYRD